jgi:hypothetical protein
VSYDTPPFQIINAVAKLIGQLLSSVSVSSGQTMLPLDQGV